MRNRRYATIGARSSDQGTKVKACLRDEADDVGLGIGLQGVEGTRSMPIIDETSRCSPIGGGDDVPLDFSCEGANLFERRLPVLAGCAKPTIAKSAPKFCSTGGRRAEMRHANASPRLLRRLWLSRHVRLSPLGQKNEVGNGHERHKSRDENEWEALHEASS
jgi:hypothetical protein